MRHRLIHAIGVCLIMASAIGSAASDVEVWVDPARQSDWHVDQRIFGRFTEHHGRDIYPGLYEEYVVNGAFEEWDHPFKEAKNELLYPKQTPHPNVAFPWEPWIDLPNRFNPSYRTVWSVEQGGTVRGHQYQRVSMVGNGNRSGIMQRIVLPDQRVKTYNITFQARGDGARQIDVVLLTSLKAPVARATARVGEDWERNSVQLSLAGLGPRYQEQEPFGEYLLVFELTQPGVIDIDDVSLMPTDAIAGKYNPTTLANMKEYGVTAIRWPGGNYASTYHWRDGVGPRDQRPVRPNMVWGGLEPNYFGTNELLEYCRLAGIEPLLNVAFNPEITPQEAADWVEYVNGSVDTPMGALRASHGYSEPWNVRLWQVGNETYGAYQYGFTSADDYARRVSAYIDAMKGVDPSISIALVGMDSLHPIQLYRSYMNWNQELFTGAKDYVEILDLHRYTRGMVNETKRNAWNPDEYNQALVTFPTLFEQLLAEVRQTAVDHDLPDLQLEVGEWNLTPESSSGWPKPDRATIAHAAYTAGMFNAFMRQGEYVRYGFQTLFDLQFRAYPGLTYPALPASYVLRLYTEPFQSTYSWRLLDLKADGPTYDMPAIDTDTRAMADVPFVDVAGLISEEAKQAVVFLVNRDLKRTHVVNLHLVQGWQVVGDVMVTALDPTRGPMARQSSWDGPDVLTIRSSSLQLENSSVAVEVPGSGVARVVITIE